MCASHSPLPSSSTGPTQVMVSLGGSSLVPYPPVEPLVEPSVVEVVVVDTRVECFSVVVVVAPLRVGPSGAGLYECRAFSART